jgi:hypothetical protein
MRFVTRISECPRISEMTSIATFGLRSSAPAVLRRSWKR